MLVKHDLPHQMMATTITNSNLGVRLPNEVVGEFFRWLSLGDPSPARYQLFFDLMLVCKRWHTLIMADPSLWCDISFDCHPLLVSHILERSKGRPLTVDCNIHFDEFSPDTDDEAADLLLERMSKFADQVQQSMHRWQKLAIDVDQFDLTPFVGILETPAPRLRSFSLHHAHGDGGEWSPPLDLFRGQANGILEFHLSKVPIFWSSPILSGLRKLACPEIEELNFTNVDVDDEAPGERIGRLGPLIILPNLRDIVVFSSTGLSAGSILDTIGSVSACQKFELSFEIPSWTPLDLSSFFSALKNLHQDLARLYNAPLIRLFFKNDTYDNHLGLTTLLTRPNTTAVVSLRLPRHENVADSSNHLLEWASKVITANPKAPPIELSLCIDLPLAKLLSIQSLKVVMLEITNAATSHNLQAIEEGYVALLEALAGKGPGTWSGRFAFPFLRLIRLEVDDKFLHQDILLKMLKSRKSAIQSGKGASAAIADGRAVRPFQVTFAGLHAQNDIMYCVAQVIGPANVLCGDTSQRRLLQKVFYEFDADRNIYLSITKLLEDDED